MFARRRSFESEDAPKHSLRQNAHEREFRKKLRDEFRQRAAASSRRRREKCETKQELDHYKNKSAEQLKRSIRTHQTGLRR